MQEVIEIIKFLTELSRQFKKKKNSETHST